jgi:hypothetical protein
VFMLTFPHFVWLALMRPFGAPKFIAVCSGPSVV